VTVEVKVPVLAESVAEANLLQWHKKVGDPVKRGENLIDIETDKVTLEVAAPTNGILTEILKQDGEDVESDELIARIETEKKSTVETPVATVEEEKPEAGSSEENTPKQHTLLEPEHQPEPKPEIKPEPEIESEPAPTEQAIPDAVDVTPKLSPAVRHLLSENELQPGDISTHKKPDRITKEDILNHLGSAISKDTTASPVPKPETPVQKEVVPEVVAPKVVEAEKQAQVVQTTPAANNNHESRPQERAPMTRLRKRAAERLLAAQHENALLTTFNEVNMQPVMELRNRYKEEFEKTHKVKLGFMSFFTRATIEALKKFPVINASVDGQDILYRGYFDIGIAVSSPRGLVVPVLRDADTLSLAAIEAGISELGQKANNGKLTIEDLTGGTFTITNGGVFGSLLSTPIINPPQSAILGMHKIQDRPVAESGEVVIRPMMYLALTYDHRIIDGRDAVQFLVTIKEQLEDPSRLLLQI
jgi:2-oxoglutarate dehydrogenase E2 component (dihydrolipoamide succinyltransferase)